MPVDKEVICKALLEKAWASQLKLDAQTEKNAHKLFAERKKIFFICNSNPIHVWRTILFLQNNLKDIEWRDLADLINNLQSASVKSLKTGLALDEKKTFFFYASCLQGVARTGIVPETNKKTKSLLGMIKEEHNLPPKETELISLWKDDLQEGRSYGYTTHNGKDFLTEKQGPSMHN